MSTFIKVWFSWMTTVRAGLRTLLIPLSRTSWLTIMVVELTKLGLYAGFVDARAPGQSYTGVWLSGGLFPPTYDQIALRGLFGALTLLKSKVSYGLVGLGTLP